MLETTFETLPGGHRLRVARLGAGTPLVLLHGYPENLQIWSAAAQHLAQRFEVIAFDWPGMGYSDAWPGGTTPMHLAERLLKLLDHWKIEKASLAAMDMGGQPALAFAAKYPHRVRHLTVMNSLVISDEKTSWEINLLRRYGLNRIILRHLPGAVFYRAERTFLPPGNRLPLDLRSDFWESFKRREVREFIVRMCAGYQGTLARLPELYAQITAPTLILWGERDKHFPPIHADRLHSMIPSSRLAIIPGAGHWMAWHLPEIVATHVCEFGRE